MWTPSSALLPLPSLRSWSCGFDPADSEQLCTRQTQLPAVPARSLYCSQSLAPSRLNAPPLPRSAPPSLSGSSPRPLPLQTPPSRLSTPPRQALPYLGISTRPSQAGPTSPGHASPLPDLAHCPSPRQVWSHPGLARCPYSRSPPSSVPGGSSTCRACV